MSKRNRSRFADLPDQKDIPSIGTDSKTQQTLKPAITGDTPDDEGNSLIDFQKIGKFFANCWGKTTALAQSMWTGLRKIPSFCVIPWKPKNKTETTDANKKPEPAKAEPAKTFARTETKTPVNKPSVVPAKKIEYDEDELAPSRWWNIGIKSAAAAAALAILAGGYFAAKPFLVGTPTEIEDAGTEDAGTIVAGLIAVSTCLPFHQTTQESRPSTDFPLAAAPAPAHEPAVQPLPQPLPDPIPEPVIEPPAIADSVPVASVPQPQEPIPSDDPFLVQSIAPTIADTAPPVANDSFGTIPDDLPKQPEPVATAPASSDNAITSISDPPPAALQPLAQLAPASIASPQLQPLVPLNASALPDTAMVAVPKQTTALTNAVVAANRNQNTRRGSTNAVFSEAPVPPSVNTLPQANIERTISVAEPVREIVPQIPPSGSVENVPPPVVPPPPVEAPVVARVMPSEPAPAIPEDLPETSSPPVVVVPARATATEVPPQILPSDIQPIDMELWEHLRALQNEVKAQPSDILFEEAATSEPALRFTPRESAAPTNEGDTLMSAAVDQFRGLQLTDELMPAANDIAPALTALADAPQPVFAVPQPAYRDHQNGSEGERGMTFQNRIDSAVSRSPSDTQTYVIQRGDTYMTISDKFYGTSLLYTALAEHNQQLGIGWRPAEGVVIEVPTAEYLRTHYGSTASQQVSRLESQHSAVRYIVQEGDTIFRLATDKLRDTNRWREIYSINADRIQDVRNLQPGMEILLPL